MTRMTAKDFDQGLLELRPRADRHADEHGYDTIVAASTGNAAASLAALAAFYDKKAIILAPADAPPAKLTQILQYNAVLYPVEGIYL